MTALSYKFMCDQCGTVANHYRFCNSCGQAMTMYSRTATHTHAVRYV